MSVWSTTSSSDVAHWTLGTKKAMRLLLYTLYCSAACIMAAMHDANTIVEGFEDEADSVRLAVSDHLQRLSPSCLCHA